MNPRRVGKRMTRRGLLRGGLTGLAVLPLLQACAQSEPSPTSAPAGASAAPTSTPVPAKPAESVPTPTTAAAAKPAEAAPTKAPEAAKPAPEKTGPANLRMTYWADIDTPGYKKCIEIFNQTFPTIKINLELIPEQYRQKLQTQIAGGVAADVMRQNSGQFHAFALRNVFVQLDSYISTDKIDKGIWWDGSVKGASYLGKMYGVPSDLNSWLLYYIKPIFDEAKIPYPDDTWDWNKLIEVAKALTKESTDPTKAQWGYHVQNWWGAPVLHRVRQNGGDFWSEKLYSESATCVADSPEAIEGTDFEYGILTKQKLSPGAGDLASFAGGRFAMYQSGKIAMWTGGSWEAPLTLSRWPKTAPDWDMTVAPKHPTKARAGIVFSDEHCLWTGGKTPDAGWEWIKFLSSDAGNRILDLDVGRSIPAVKAVAEDPKYVKMYGKNMQATLDELGWSWPTSDDNPYSFEIQEVMNPLLDDLYRGAKDAKTAMPMIAKGVNQVLVEKRGK